jgi:hypothetical protein
MPVYQGVFQMQGMNCRGLGRNADWDYWDYWDIGITGIIGIWDYWDYWDTISQSHLSY